MSIFQENETNHQSHGVGMYMYIVMWGYTRLDTCVRGAIIKGGYMKHLVIISVIQCH